MNNSPSFEALEDMIRRVNNSYLSSNSNPGSGDREATPRKETTTAKEHSQTLESEDLVLKTDKIIGHFYKNKNIRFRGTSSSFDIIVIQTLEEAMARNREILQEYVRSLSTRAISTIVARHPRALKLLKRQETRSRERVMNKEEEIETQNESTQQERK